MYLIKYDMYNRESHVFEFFEYDSIKDSYISMGVQCNEREVLTLARTLGDVDIRFEGILAEDLNDLEREIFWMTREKDLNIKRLVVNAPVLPPSKME